MFYIDNNVEKLYKNIEDWLKCIKCFLSTYFYTLYLTYDAIRQKLHIDIKWIDSDISALKVEKLKKPSVLLFKFV